MGLYVLKIDPMILACAPALLALAVVCSSPASAQRAPDGDGLGPSLRDVAPELNARLVGLERAQGVLFGALMGATRTVDEAAVFQRVTLRLSDLSAAARPDAEADKGYAALGTRGAEIIKRTQAFHREVLWIFVTIPPADRKRALEAAVQKYRSRPDLAVAGQPKDMTILYDHPFTSYAPPRPGETEPLRQLAYPTLTGFIWSAHWYQLAVQEPLERFVDPVERDRGLATVAERLRRKLSSATPPDAFPTELPLAPSIAPGLVALHNRAASILDNLNMMLDVIADVLVHPGVVDRRAAVNEVIAQFTDPQYRCVPVDEWIVVALRHGIFEQGGPALGGMNGDERNAFYGGHGQHYARRRTPTPCDAE